MTIEAMECIEERIVRAVVATPGQSTKVLAKAMQVREGVVAVALAALAGHGRLVERPLPRQPGARGPAPRGWFPVPEVAQPAGRELFAPGRELFAPGRGFLATPLGVPASVPEASPEPRSPLASDALSRRLWDGVAAARVLHRHQVEALRGIVVRDWDAERLVLAPGTMADYRLALEYRRDVERFLARAEQFRCVVEVLGPEPTPEPEPVAKARAVP